MMRGGLSGGRGLSAAVEAGARQADMSPTSRTGQREAAQQEAVDVVVRALELPAASLAPERGLRTQVIMVTGSGKTRVAARSAEKLRASRVLVLVPSLDLLTQTETAWHEAGRRGPMIGVSSLRDEELSFPNTMDVEELVDWVRPFDRVTVFATFASLGLGTLERAHQAGLPK